MRELREFRAHHEAFEREGVAVAGVSLDPPGVNRAWATRLSLPYPLLADPAREAARAFGVLRRLGISGWGVELLQRSTFLVGADGEVAAVWGKVRIRGHALEVLAAARALERAPS